MKTCATLLLLLAAQPASAAELYADIGLGKMWGAALELGPSAKVAPPTPGDPSSEPAQGIKESDSPHAAVEVGYSFGSASVFVLHASSLASSRDMGVNFVGVKYRFSMKVP